MICLLCLDEDIEIGFGCPGTNCGITVCKECYTEYKNQLHSIHTGCPSCKTNWIQNTVTNDNTNNNQGNYLMEVGLVADYVYLDIHERNMFYQVAHDYLAEQG